MSIPVKFIMDVANGCFGWLPTYSALSPGVLAGVIDILTTSSGKWDCVSLAKRAAMIG